MISVQILGDAETRLLALASLQGITLEEALKKAIATETYFVNHTKLGFKTLLVSPDKEIRSVIFRC